MKLIETLNQKIELLKEEETIYCQKDRSIKIKTKIELLEQLKEEFESVPAETLVIASEHTEGSSANGAVTDDKLILNWQEGELIGGNPLYYLDNCHGVSVDNYVDRIEIKFYQRVKENGKTYCRITKKHILDVAKLAEALKLIDFCKCENCVAKRKLIY
jgi:ribosomal protein L9